MNEILCSTGALIGRPNKRDYRLLEELSQKLTCDGFEFMMYSTWYDEVESIIAFLKESSLTIPVFHCEKGIGEAMSKEHTKEWEDGFRRFEINCNMAQEIGAKKVVLHLWNGRISDSCFASNRYSYSQLHNIACEYNVDLLIENVVCNVENPMKHWCELAENYPNIHFVFDTKMAAFHNQLEWLYQEDYEWLYKEGHIQHYHVNDYAGGYMDWSQLSSLPIGAGHIDFDRFFSFVRKIGYSHMFTIEATAFDREGKVNTDMLNQCFESLREKWKQSV